MDIKQKNTRFSFREKFSLTKKSHPKIWLSILAVFFASLFLLLGIGYIHAQESISNRLKGRILLQVEQKGESWYINPVDKKRYFMGRPNNAFNVMRDTGIGITNKDLKKISIAEANMEGEDADGDGLSNAFEDAVGTDKNNIDTDKDGYNDKAEIINGYNPNGQGKINIDNSFANEHKGKIFIQVEAHGEAWYVNPVNKKRYFLFRPSDAFNVMRGLGLGITDNDLNKIEYVYKKTSMCGDGICDALEQVNPDLCLGDCGLTCKTDVVCKSNNYCNFKSCDDVEGKCIKVPQDCSLDNNPVCGCDGKTYSNDCLRQMAKVSQNYKGECKEELLDVPYSFFYVHTECWEENGVCVTDPDKWGKLFWQGPYDQVEWVELGKLVELADKYNVPLTLMFWPTAVDVILKNQSKINTIKLWQANGHEIGIHVQYNGQGKFNPERDIEKYHLLLDSKYQQVIRSGTTVDKDETTPTEMIYDVGGRAGPDDTHKDGRNSKAVMNIFNEHLTYRLNGRAEYLYPEFKITEYNSLNSNEIYGAGLHPVDIMSDPKIIEDWFKFLYEKDPEGKKRKTVSDLMETYIIPNDLIIHERCGNTIWDGDERRTGLCEIDHADCEKSNGDIRVCDNGYANKIFLMGRTEVCGDSICNEYQGENKDNCPDDCGGDR